MAFKKAGHLDWSRGRLGYFICYCPFCRHKIVKTTEELHELEHILNIKFREKRNPIRTMTIKALGSLLDRLDYK